MQDQLFDIPNTRELTLFSFGGGQDSWAILVKLIHDPEFREKYAPNKLLIKQSDTGWEHPQTYYYTAKAEQLCKEHDIPFFLVKPEMGCHPRTWQHLTHNWEKNHTVGSLAFPQTCTDNIKIKVVDKFAAQWIKENYEIKSTTKANIYKEFYYKHGTIHRILGIAAGEEKRIGNQKHFPKWKQKTFKYVYPLVEQGIDRQGAQDIIKEYGYPVPPPSNCTICFYMSEQELLWLHRNLPDHLSQWIKLERNKLNKNRANGLPEKKNHGPFAGKTIVQKLKIAIEKYGHWTDEKLEEYKMSHGHCVKSKY